MGPGSALLLLGRLLFAAAGVLAGVQLVRMARAEQGFGAHALAAAAICVGGLSLVLMPLGQALGPGPGTAIALAGELLLRAAVAGLWVFVWRVFHPGRGPGAVLAGIGIAFLLAVGAWDLAAQPDLTRYDASLPSAHAMQLAVALPFLWSALQSGRTWLQARRRLALGLADPMTTERFRIWAVATLLLAAICGLGALVGALDAAGRTDTAEALRALRGLAYVPVAVGIWLGLAPPAAFTAWVQRRAGAAASR